MTEPLLTPQEVATWLKMSRVWVYKQAERGLIPFHRVGEAIRFDPNEILSYLNERRNIKKTYEESRNPKTRKKAVRLQRQQECIKSD
jgi:putative molybdopterin biosynthesis protein